MHSTHKTFALSLVAAALLGLNPAVTQAQSQVAMSRAETFDYALKNLEGCWAKLEDAKEGRFGMTPERAVADTLEPLSTYTNQLRDIFTELQREGKL